MKTRKWKVRALMETADRRPEAFLVTAFRKDRDPQGHVVPCFIVLEGQNLPDPNLSPRQAERLAAALTKAAKWARA